MDLVFEHPQEYQGFVTQETFDLSSFLTNRFGKNVCGGSVGFCKKRIKYLDKMRIEMINASEILKELEITQVNAGACSGPSRWGSTNNSRLFGFL